MSGERSACVIRYERRGSFACETDGAWAFLDDDSIEPRICTDKGGRNLLGEIFSRSKTQHVRQFVCLSVRDSPCSSVADSIQCFTANFASGVCANASHCSCKRSSGGMPA